MAVLDSSNGRLYSACPICHTTLRHGAIICPRCGHSWLTRATTHNLDTTWSPLHAVSDPSLPSVVTHQTTIVFQIEGQAVALPRRDKIVVGRWSPTDVPLDLDLSPFDAHLRGVSRLHLEIHRAEATVLVVDLESTNGTWLNGCRLVPASRYRLCDQDALHLGRLEVQVRFTLRRSVKAE